MGSGARVLIVEDDPANRQTLSALLSQMGYATIVTERADEALRVLNTDEKVDLVVSDVVMPGMNGIEFAKRARGVRPQTSVVLVTGDSDVVDSVIQNGAIALLKPYSADTLRRIVKESLDRA